MKPPIDTSFNQLIQDRDPLGCTSCETRKLYGNKYCKFCIRYTYRLGDPDLWKLVHNLRQEVMDNEPMQIPEIEFQLWDDADLVPEL